MSEISLCSVEGMLQGKWEWCRENGVWCVPQMGRTGYEDVAWDGLASGRTLRTVSYERGTPVGRARRRTECTMLCDSDLFAQE